MHLASTQPLGPSSPPILRRLERLAETEAGRFGLQLHVADVMAPPRELHGGYDAVVGFFVHHFHDLEACFAGIAQLAKPGSTVTFLEPNPLNPLYYLQIALTPRMTWEGDGGVTRMHPRILDCAARLAGLRDLAVSRFGFFPPALANRKRGADVERRLESASLCAPGLPFTLTRWRRV